jgi:integrase
VEVPEGGANITWNPKKQKGADVLRKCFVTPETMVLVKEYQADLPSTMFLYPHSDTTMANMLHRLFKTLKEDVSSHNFRHTKLTDLGGFLRPQEIRDYAGHSSIRVTDRYLHSNQEGVLRKVVDAYRGSKETDHELTPRKRAAKATEKFDAQSVLQARNQDPERTNKNDSIPSDHSIKTS